MLAMFIVYVILTLIAVLCGYFAFRATRNAVEWIRDIALFIMSVQLIGWPLTLLYLAICVGIAIWQARRTLADNARFNNARTIEGELL